MSRRTLVLLLVPLAVMALVVTGFVLVNAEFRQLEAAAAVAVLHLVGLVPAHRIQVIAGTSSIAVFPMAVGPFVAVLQPACSALGSLLTLGFLALFVPRGHPGHRIAALGCALAAVFVGNVLRIAGSIGIGLIYGTPSLALFHDFVGSMFAVAYTLGGYLLMLFLLLPAGTAPSIPTHRSAAAPTRVRGGQGAHRVSV